MPPDSPSEGGLVELAPGVFAPEDALRFQTSRSGGPGGQNVNKVNTKVEVWLDLAALRGLAPDAIARLRALAGSRLTNEGLLHIVAQTSRTQEGNRADVMDRLRELLVRAKHRPRPRRATRPSRASKFRRLDEKKRRSQTKAHRRVDD